MILNNEEYLTISECSTKFSIHPTMLRKLIRQESVTHTRLGRYHYIMASSLNNLIIIKGNQESLLTETARLQNKLDQAKSLIAEAICFSKPQVSEEAVAEAFHLFLVSMKNVLGENGALLSALVSGGNLAELSLQTGKSLSELNSGIRIAISQLRYYRMDIPIFRKRLAETLTANQSLRLENKLLREKLNTLILNTGTKQPDNIQAEIPEHNEHFWELLSTPLSAFPLSIRTINATQKGALITLFDFIVANKACGISGILGRLSNFGLRSYREIEGMLLKQQLITILPSGQWASPADCMIDETSLIYIKYRNKTTDKDPHVPHRPPKTNNRISSNHQKRIKTVLYKEEIK